MVVIIPEQRKFPGTNGTGMQKKFDDLINYLLSKFGQEKTNDLLQRRYQVENSHEIALPGFTDILTYAVADPSLVQSPKQSIPTNPSHPDDESHHKCIAVETHGVADISTAIIEMNAVASQNRRVKDPAYHFILSWPEHEKPDNEQIFDAGRHALAALGLQEHQHVMAIHGNTDNIHCHITVNRIHPVSYKSRHLSHSKRKLHYAARESEIKHGWTHDNGIYLVKIDAKGNKRIVKNLEVDQYNNHENPLLDLPRVDHSTEQSPSGPFQENHSQTGRSPKNKSQWTDPDSLIHWLRSHVGPSLNKQLPNLDSWAALHKALSLYGISLKDTGGGGMRLHAVDAMTGEVLDIPASRGLRQLKRTQLETRWGKFTPSTDPYLSHRKATNHAPEVIIGIDYDEGKRRSRGQKITGQIATVASLQHLPSSQLDADTIEFESVLHVDEINLMDDREVGGANPPLRLPLTRSRGGNSRVTDPQPLPPHRPITLADLYPKQRSQTGQFPGTPSRNDRRKERDPESRSLRANERAAQRLELRRRYETYRQEIKEQQQVHAELRTAMYEQQASERRQLIQMQPSTHSKEPRGLQPLNKAILKIQLQDRHNQERSRLAQSRTKPLPWREWLLQEAQKGDQAALSAIRGIVYQAKRDKINSPSEPSPELAPIEIKSQDDADYLAIAKRLLQEDLDEESIRSANAKKQRPYECDPLIPKLNHLSWTVSNNGNLHIYAANQHLFTDRGNRLTFDRQIVTDDDLRLALLHAKEKFGPRLTLTGQDPVFVARMAKMANDLGIKVINPELQSLITEYQQSKSLSATPTPATPTHGPSLNAGLPKETDIERVRQSVLASNPAATFVTIDPAKPRSYHGKITHVQPAAFAQRVGRNAFAIHPASAPLQPIPTGSITIRYHDGQPVIIEKTKTTTRGRN